MSRRHRVKTLKLSRNFNQRKALIKGLLISLINHGEITTTLAKAKAVKSLFDKLTAKAQKNTTHARRQIAATLSNAKAANKLVDTIAPSMASRHGGFTSIKKTTIRQGDASLMANLTLTVPLPEPAPKKTKQVKPKTKPVSKTAKTQTKTKNLKTVKEKIK